MLHSPTMPRWRTTWIAISRRRWYSSFVSVCDGATTMLSPVWMPIGSKFSMLQTVMQLSARSRTTSYSISFQPARYSSMRTWGAEAKALLEGLAELARRRRDRPLPWPPRA